MPSKTAGYYHFSSPQELQATITLVAFSFPDNLLKLVCV